jgi:hypothetical protein
LGSRRQFRLSRQAAIAPKANYKRKSTAPPAVREARRTKQTKKTEGSQTDPVYVSRPLFPHVPSEKTRKEKLQENLKKMGCSYLMEVPWKWTSKVMLQELVFKKVPEHFQDTIRGCPGKWTKELIGRALNLEVNGEVIPQRASAEDYLEYFNVSPHNSDGWKFSDCNHQELRDVLHFLIHSIRPTKVTRLNVGPVATIANCLLKGKKIFWAGVLKGVINKEVGNLKPAHPECYLPAYVVRLYLEEGVLTGEEETNYTAYYQAVGMEDSDEEAVGSESDSADEAMEEDQDPGEKGSLDERSLEDDQDQAEEDAQPTREGTTASAQEFGVKKKRIRHRSG